MPGFNRRGPMGNGSMTGRGMGFCNPVNQETTVFGGFGRNMGRRNMGQGNNAQDQTVYSKDPDELSALKSELKSIKLMLDIINKKLTGV